MKQQENIFCLYYAKTLNPKQSAIRAGFESAHAEEVALKLLQRKDIIKNVENIFSNIQTKNVKMKAIAGLEQIAFGSVNDSIKLMFVADDFSKTQLDELNLFHISEIKRPKDGSLEIKFADRFKAMEKLISIADNMDNSAGMGDFYGALMQSANSLGKQGEDG